MHDLHIYDDTLTTQEMNELYAAESEDDESKSDASDRKIIFIFWFCDCKINKYLS